MVWCVADSSVIRKHHAAVYRIYVSQGAFPNLCFNNHVPASLTFQPAVTGPHRQANAGRVPRFYLPQMSPLCHSQLELDQGGKHARQTKRLPRSFRAWIDLHLRLKQASTLYKT